MNHGEHRILRVICFASRSLDFPRVVKREHEHYVRSMRSSGVQRVIYCHAVDHSLGNVELGRTEQFSVSGCL
jgi:hypothetical protein